MKKYKIVVDENIAMPEAFGIFGNVIKIKGSEITNDLLKDCEILVVRSVTKVDEKLLRNTAIKFVGTATSGIDHIDINYLQEKNIFFADAYGCNSYAVAEYVIIVITKLLSAGNESFNNKTIGIVGFGNIGSKVAKMCQSLGMNVLINDPPLKKSNPNLDLHHLEEVLNCDIISLHVPLTFTGEHRTLNLLDENLYSLKENSILINTARGGVLNEKTLLDILKDKNLNIVTDLWLNEPYVNGDLLANSDISTPHIAGYSIEGKTNGSKIIFEQLNRFLKTNYSFDFNDQSKTEIISFDEDINPENLNRLFKIIYDIEKDSSEMKRMIDMKADERKFYFESLRKNYQLRKSFKDFVIKTSRMELAKVFENLRFQVKFI